MSAQSQIGRPPEAPPGPRPATPASPIRLTSSPTWLDTSNRAAIVGSYLNTYVPSGAVPTGWVGNVSTGIAGTTTTAYQNAVLLRVNWMRQMAGVPTPITFSPSYNAEDQQAALMMSANGQLNHTPPTDWLFYTAPGADAAGHSNLCLDIPYLNDPGCVAQYMQDPGSNNPEAGHRRWILYPQTQTMGTGDVQPPYPQGFVNALWVIDSHFFDARPATRDAYVAWPPRGFVPYELIPGRWSFSYPGADFTNTTVSMQRGGTPVTVRLETPLQGYGDNTVVWVPDNIDTSVSTHWPQPLADTPITVTLSRVSIAGVDTSFTYTVTVIDPNAGMYISGHITTSLGAQSGALVTLNGGPTATSDSNGAYSFGPLTPGTYLAIPTLPGYSFAPSSRSVSLTTSTADFTGSFCDFSGLGTNLRASPRGGGGFYSFTLPVGCPWTVTSNASWLTVPAANASGTGNISISFNYSANHNAARTGTLTVGGENINVTQASAGQSLIGPLSPGIFFGGTWANDYNGNGIFDAGDKFFAFQIYGIGDTPLAGDWNGDGHAKAGVYNHGFWALDYNGNGQFDGITVDRFYGFGGVPGETPITGDWNGDGRTKVGYYSKGFWALDYNGNGQWDGPVIDRFYGFGGDPAAIPLVGDWNGDGRAKVGYYLNGLWVLDYNGNGQWDGAVIDRYTTFTIGGGEKPVIGDWSGDGRTKIGVWRNGFWVLDTNGNGVYEYGIDQFAALGGNPGETPLVGDWTGNGKSKIGFYYRGFWALDYNGNGRWDGTGTGNDRFIALGGNANEIPVPGKW